MIPVEPKAKTHQGIAEKAYTVENSSTSTQVALAPEGFGTTVREML